MTDWNDIYRRLGAVRETLERGHAPDAAHTQRLLAARAQVLARQADSERLSDDLLELVEFTLAHETYAVESRFVREIQPLRDLTPLPCTPAHVMGIVNLRGHILSVIDIRKFFDLPERGLTDLNKLIVLTDGEMEFGILADVVVGARAIAADGIQPSLPTLSGIRSDYLKGVTAERMVVLDAQKLLSDRKILVQEEVND